MLKPLRQGDKIAIISTARKIALPELEAAVQTFEQWGLEVVLGKTIGASYNQFAGDDALRLEDLQQMLDNPAIKGIVCARGGYGTSRIIDQVDFSSFVSNPKWIVGFSDVTTLHSHVHNLGIESIHAIMPVLFSREGSEAAKESLRQLLFGEAIAYTAPPHAFNRTGKAKGKIVGGNLSMLHTLAATRSDISTQGKILFIEDLDEYLYHIDRMLVHLDRAGKLAGLAGLIVGHMSDMRDNAIPFGKDAYEIIAEHAGKYHFPVCFNFPVGHEPHNMALVCGREAILHVQEGEVRLQYT
ncbi:LD-carboxypeptidase [Pontibacter sp. SGAir0037]|uniref:S66 peptidase family protein n=1 Tax=Pontibacter sp. SGAir0037 TaxID=2571030 RepID=UPI0010CD3509|nr:LD-carboxypeptidase [Pontibacter sp. SGAir0037]QCR23539.1 LD-carboxypeptidase [Pontibacter sp. SGAir0037]